MDKKIKKGFSLIEVLIFVTILGLIFVTAMALTTYSINVMKIDQEKILAVHYAEEGLEWIRFQKESDWDYFTSLDLSSGGGTTYCLNSLSWSNQGNCNAINFFGTPNIYWREVTLTNQGGSPISQSNVEEKVYWKNGGVNFNVSLKTTFKILE